MAFSIPSLIGVFITIAALAATILNLFILFTIAKGGLLKNTSSSIYLLAFSNIICNCIDTGITAFYLGPSVILQTNLFASGPTGTENRILSYLTLAAWYTDMQITCIIAINQVSYIVFPNTLGKIFTRRVVKTLSILLMFTGFFMAFVSAKLLPCCAPLFDYSTYWEAFFDTGFPYTDYFVDIPHNCGLQAIAILCYIIVFVHVRKTNHMLAPTIYSAVSEVRKKQEIRLALQFCAVSGFALFSWAGMRVFPYILDTGKYIPHVAFGVILNGSVNSIIFITINTEVRKCIKSYWEKISSTQKAIVNTITVKIANTFH